MVQYNAECLIMPELPEDPCDFWFRTVYSNLSSEWYTFEILPK